ncbi:MAG: 30S ribosomal protein S14 [Chlamydiia bacterium]|nr:30S ribosomal protein S14 [Chlamydiia bacterium]
MAKKSSVVKEKRREEQVKRAFAKRQELKQRAVNMNLTEEEREDARVKLNKMKRDTSPTRLRNRCNLTGRSRGYLRKFGLSRLCFREMALRGEIPGVVKASW